MEAPRNFWIRSIILPLVVALVASQIGFWVSYVVVVKPGRLQGQAEIRSTRFIDNIRSVQSALDEKEQQGEPVAEDREKLEELKEYVERYNDYYEEGKVEKALGEIGEGDDQGRKFFPDDWIYYPQPGEDQNY